MSTPPNALTGPVWVDAEGNGFTSADGGKTFTPVTLGGGGTVHTDATMTGDGSVGSPLHAIPTFGQDTTISINNSAAAPVTALELISSLTTNTAGAEASQWLTKLLLTGAQTTSRIDRPGSAWFPNGSASVPGVGFLGTALDGTTGKGYGMWYDQSNSRLMFSANGASAMSMDGTEVLNWSPTGRFHIGTNQLCGMARNSSADIQFGTEHDIVVGADGALATNATAGHLEIPTCAGTPTGTVTVRSGKAVLIYDTTNLKLALSVGSGTWKQTAALT